MPYKVKESADERKNGRERTLSNPNAAGRPEKPLNWVKLDSLIAMQCRLEEIATAMDISVNQLEERVQKKFGIKFLEYFNIKRQNGFTSLRTRQYQLAMSGNPTMLIWLGKNWLGQTDKAELSVNGKVDFNVNVNPNLLPAVYRDAKAEIINDS